MEIGAAQERALKQPALAGRPALANITNPLAQPLFPQPLRPASDTSSGWTTCTSYAASIGDSPVPLSPATALVHLRRATAPPAPLALPPSSAPPPLAPPLPSPATSVASSAPPPPRPPAALALTAPPPHRCPCPPLRPPLPRPPQRSSPLPPPFLSLMVRFNVLIDFLSSGGGGAEKVDEGGGGTERYL